MVRFRKYASLKKKVRSLKDNGNAKKSVKSDPRIRVTKLGETTEV